MHTLTLTLPCSFSWSRIMSTSSMLQSWLSSETFRDISSIATSIGFISVLCCSTTWIRFFRYGKQELAEYKGKENPHLKRQISEYLLSHKDKHSLVNIVRLLHCSSTSPCFFPDKVKGVSNTNRLML